jgi:hypothetical protein
MPSVREFIILVIKSSKKWHEIVLSIFFGKKVYQDMLSNENELIAYHCRMKGITANQRYGALSPVEFKSGLFVPMYKNKSSIMQLYEDLYNGVEIEFDLCAGSAPCFDMKSDFSITTKKTFFRKIKC